MPIDNVTTAELEAYIAANPTAVDTVFKPALTAKEYAVMSKTEKEAYNSDLESQLSISRTARIAPKVEKFVKDTTGIEKASADEKYYKYQERALSTLAAEKKVLAAEVAVFKGKSDITAAERAQLDSALLSIKAKDGEIASLKDASGKEISKARLENEIIREASVVDVKLIKSDIAGMVKAQQVIMSQTLAKVSEMAQKDSRGKIILMKSDGKPVLNSDNTFTTVAQFVEAEMKEAGFVDDGKNQKGADGKPLNVDASQIPGGAKTQGELLTILKDTTMKGKSQRELVAEFDKYAHLLPR